MYDDFVRFFCLHNTDFYCENLIGYMLHSYYFLICNIFQVD
jgi:hypothetical protein